MWEGARRKKTIVAAIEGEGLWRREEEEEGRKYYEFDPNF